MGKPFAGEISRAGRVTAVVVVGTGATPPKERTRDVAPEKSLSDLPESLDRAQRKRLETSSALDSPQISATEQDKRTWIGDKILVHSIGEKWGGEVEAVEPSVIRIGTVVVDEPESRKCKCSACT